MRSFLDTLIERGTDRYGEVHSPMFVSILDCVEHVHPGCVLPAIDGQRQADRAPFGGNLQHDLMLLRACEYLGDRGRSDMTGDAQYREAARAYLKFFLDECTHTATGLWPWGEHAHWDFYKEAPGHNTHEYLGAPPLQFWELAWQLNPEAVLREANGLLNHVVNLETFDYNRHADIAKPLPEPRPEGLGFLDFPRHGGFYMQVWAFAFSESGEQKYLTWCEKMMDHHTAARNPDSGLMPSTTSQDADRAHVLTQLSLAVSMLESVPLLGETETASRTERLAKEYLEPLATLPHRPAEGLYVSSCPVTGPASGDTLGFTPAFTAHYGQGLAAGDALLWAQAYRLATAQSHGEEQYLTLASEMAQYYADADGIPEADHTRAQVYGTIINLMLDMHELDGGEHWLPAAERYAREAIEKLYCNGLFRGGTSLWYYESELWVSNLVYALVRLDAVLTGPKVRVLPNCFSR